MGAAEIEYIVIFGLFAICTYYSIGGGITCSSSIVYPHTSVFLKALCCLVIVCHHFALRSDGGILNSALQIGGGTYALVIFLFLSSYGIVKSEIKHNTGVKEYARHRLWKLLLPYLFVTIVSIVAYYLIGAQADTEVLKPARVSQAFVDLGGHNVTFIDVIGYVVGYKSFSGSMWFVGVTLYSYIAFGLSKCITTQNGKNLLLNKKIFVLTLYTVFLVAFALFTYSIPDQFPAHYYRNLWALWLGMTVALYEKEILSKGIVTKIALYMVANITMFAWVKLTASGDMIYCAFANIGLLSILVGNLLFRYYSLKSSSLICQLAVLSYCIYLIHGKVLTIEWWYLGYVSVILVVAVCIILAILTNKLMNYALRK